MIKLQLDTGAVAALFPPGSEAEVTLTNAVVLEFIKKANLLKTLTAPQVKSMLDATAAQAKKDCDNALASARSSIIRKIEEEAGLTTRDGQGNRVLTATSESAIRSAVITQCSAEFKAIVDAKVQTRLAELTEGGKINEWVDTRLAQLLESEMTLKLKTALDNLLGQKS